MSLITGDDDIAGPGVFMFGDGGDRDVAAGFGDGNGGGDAASGDSGGDGYGFGYGDGFGYGFGYGSGNPPTVAAYDSPDNMPALLRVMAAIHVD